MLLFAFTDCRAQIKLAPNVKAKYDSVFHGFYPSFRKRVERGEKKGWLEGLAPIEFYKTDTLNKEEFIPDTTNYPRMDTMLNFYPMTTLSAGPNDKGGYFPTAIFSNDTLYLFMEQGLNTTITGGKIISSFYREVNQFDSLYNHLPDLEIPVEISIFTISTLKLKYRAEQILYGEVEFETLPFYERNTRFKGGRIYKRILCKYVFKVRIKGNRVNTK